MAGAMNIGLEVAFGVFAGLVVFEEWKKSKFGAAVVAATAVITLVFLRSLFG